MTQYKCSKCGVVLACKATYQIHKLKERIGDWMERKYEEDRRSGY